MPKVSVLIASYNHAKFIKRTIESVQNQTFQDFEIIVVIDGSSDHTREVLDTIQDPRIHVHELPYNQGISAASNVGLQYCTGEYIAILDSDDCFREDKLMRQTVFLDEHPEYGTVGTQASLIDENDNVFEDKLHPYYTIFKKKHRSQAEWLRRFFYVGNCICHPSIMVRKSVFDKVGKYNTAMQQIPDFDIVVRLVAQAPFYLIEEEMVYVRVRKQAANNSAYSAEKDLRNQYEQIDMLQTYTRLTPELAAEVFAEEASEAPLTQETVPYVAARAALRVSWACTRYFGEKVLGDMMNNEAAREILYARYGFTTKKFYELLGNYKVFESEHIDAHTLYAAAQKDFTEQCKLVKYNRIYEKQSSHRICDTFVLKETMIGMRTFRWDPTEKDICSVCIDSLRARDESGQWREIPVAAIESNAVRRLGKRYVFITKDPMFLFQLDFDACEIQINSIIEYAWNFLEKKYPEVLETALQNYYGSCMRDVQERKLMLFRKDSKQEITHIPMGMQFDFVAEFAAEPETWMTVAIDERVYIQNHAICIENLMFEGTGQNGENTRVTVVSVPEEDKNKKRYFIKGTGALWLLAEEGTVNITVRGRISRFTGWDSKRQEQPAVLPWHPLKEVMLKYYENSEISESRNDAFLEKDIATAVLLVSRADGRLLWQPCSENLGAYCVKGAYCIDAQGIQREVRMKHGKKGAWNLFAGTEPPEVELESESCCNALFVIKYGIIMGTARTVLKKLLFKRPGSALKIALQKGKNKLKKR